MYGYLSSKSCDLFAKGYQKESSTYQKKIAAKNLSSIESQNYNEIRQLFFQITKALF